MEITCLSIPNPQSYLICAGIQDIENRGSDTDYRGPVYVHSSGRFAIRGMPRFDDQPVPVIHEFNEMLGSIADMDRQSRYVGIADAGVRVYLKNEDSQDQAVVNEYALLSTVYHRYSEHPREPFFLVDAIIGKVDLVDVTTSSDSRFARDGSFHWVLRDPHLFANPITGIRTSRSGLWKHEIPDPETRKGDRA